nr:gypsy retrotransposon integrase-like protein 1 [Tanacetum cinerariifolium]
MMIKESANNEEEMRLNLDLFQERREATAIREARMDVLDPFPEAPRKVKFVIVAIDYFTKLIEAKPLAKTTGKEVDELPNILWAHQTSLKTSNGETPYNLTFGSEAVIQAKIGMPTHRTMMIKESANNEEEMRLNLDLFQERREATAIREASINSSSGLNLHQQ